MGVGIVSAMRVRVARAGDAAAMAQVHTQSWADAYEGLLPTDLIASQTVSGRTEMWGRSIESDRMRCWVAETDGGEIVGICSIGPSQDDTAIGQLYTIYVLGAEWGRGVGSLLWEVAMAGLADLGHDTAELWVLDTNVRARSFYEGKGWTHDGVVKMDDSFGEPIREVRYRSA